MFVSSNSEYWIVAVAILHLILCTIDATLLKLCREFVYLSCAHFAMFNNDYGLFFPFNCNSLYLFSWQNEHFREWLAQNNWLDQIIEIPFEMFTNSFKLTNLRLWTNRKADRIIVPMDFDINIVCFERRLNHHFNKR